MIILWSIAVITPHMGCATKKTLSDMAEIAAMNILAGLAGKPMLSPVE